MEGNVGFGLVVSENKAVIIFPHSGSWIQKTELRALALDGCFLNFHVHVNHVEM
jgi:hypothetical protein